MISKRIGRRGNHGPKTSSAVKRSKTVVARRLVQEAQARGIEVEVTDPMKFSLFVDEGAIDIHYAGEPFTHDAVIPRIGHSITKHGVAIKAHGTAGDLDG